MNDENVDNEFWAVRYGIRFFFQGGLDQDKIRAMIRSGEGVDHVRTQAELTRMKYAVRGVPLFIVGEKYKVSGAQDSEVRRILMG